MENDELDLQYKINAAREYIKEKIEKSFLYDYGLSEDVSSSDRLFMETVTELQIIDYILEHGYKPGEEVRYKKMEGKK